MKSELNEKISCCCSLFRIETYKGLLLEELTDMILFANQFLSEIDTVAEMEKEQQEAGGFNQYYSIWYKSIYPVNANIGFLIRYNRKNEITQIINGFEVEDKFKTNILSILGVVGISLVANLSMIEETLNRFRIAAGCNIEINIYRDEIQIDNILSSFREKQENPQMVSSILGTPLQYDIGAITRIFNYCKENTFTVGFETFINAVVTADFSTIYNANNTVTSKCAYLISVVKKFVDDKDWYRKAAHSINSEPTRCSGMKVPSEWKNGLKMISKSITPY